MEGSDVRCKITKAMKEARPMSRQLCLSCKGGRLLCGMSSCPLLKKLEVQAPLTERIGRDVDGPSPSIFVGWGGYPQVSVGQLTSFSPDTASASDNPGGWYGLGFEDIIAYRSSLIRSKKKQGVFKRNGFIDDLREIALSVNPVEVEARYKNPPKFSLEFNPVSQPMGPSGVLEKMDLTGNPKIPRRVDSVVNDDLKSQTQVGMLYESDFDVYYLSGVLSSGILGLEDKQKMVPTRWSITAIDGMLAKKMMEEIRGCPQINEFLVFENTYLENHFEIILMPGAWEFELFEAWSPNTLWTMNESEPVIQVEYEGHDGRTKYAFNEGGGYYAGRLAVAEYLSKIRRQARAIVFREIYEGYVVPVGVWEVRENVRHAFTKKPKRFQSMREALSDIETRLRIPVRNYTDKSRILAQKRITDYF
ncbi:MAG TPA: hypothetical protein ENN13_02750 [Candidatus Altiarchaeales archaeon]|nr:hypothetical protein [Candidatus Altiarchaeales archaeon]